MVTEDVKSASPLTVATESVGTEINLSKPNEDLVALGNLTVLTEAQKSNIYEYISKPKEIKTPAEKVKKRPDGFDYVEASWMDYQTKQFMPLYEYKLIHLSIEHGWINVIVSLKDRITGNV